MKVVYSYKGKSPDEFLLKMARLSVISVKNFTLYPTELYVDSVNYAYFKDFPYDNVVITDFDGLNTTAWNMSKLYTYSQQDEPFLHIDFDTCILAGFFIPDAMFVCEKTRYALMDSEYMKYAYNQFKPEHIVCSGFIGGTNYGDLFKEHYEWAKKQIKDVKEFSYRHLISLEEVAMTQRLKEFGITPTPLPESLFLHFWCRRNCGKTKEDVYGDVVGELLNFNVMIRKGG